MDILSKIAKLSFEDVDTLKKVGLERRNYMVTVQDGPTKPQQLVPMEWASGVDQVGLLNLLFMPHFGHNMQVNMYVKHLLLYFHRGFLCIDRPYHVDVELISSIMSLLKTGKDPSPYLHQNMDAPKMK